MGFQEHHDEHARKDDSMNLFQKNYIAGIAFALLLGGGGATGFSNSSTAVELVKINQATIANANSIVRLEKKIDRMLDKFDVTSADRWTATDQKEFMRFTIRPAFQVMDDRIAELEKTMR